MQIIFGAKNILKRNKNYPKKDEVEPKNQVGGGSVIQVTVNSSSENTYFSNK
jgi:hypothetical protein